MDTATFFIDTRKKPDLLSEKPSMRVGARMGPFSLPQSHEESKAKESQVLGVNKNLLSAGKALRNDLSTFFYR